MAKSPDDLRHLARELSPHGLLCFGGLLLTKDECAVGSQAMVGRNALLVGNVGADMWHVFRRSPEFSDGMRDPMNRWTKRVLDAVSLKLGCSVVYPFDDPYWPFQRLARKAVGIQNSPLGVLIHPEYGLWHAFRGLLIFKENHQLVNQIKALIESAEVLNHPCDSCEDQPCLSTCPVGAFTDEGLDVNSCFSFLDGSSGSECMLTGCQARRACPIGTDYRQDSAQLQFHMKSYRGL